MDQPPKRPAIFNPRRRELIKHYTNGEVTVIWKPKLCIHSAVCYSGLPEVFDPDKRPWITPESSTTAAIIAQVGECPSEALTYFMNDSKEQTPGNAALEVPEPVEEKETAVSVEILPNGPLLLRGLITLKDSQGNEMTKGPVTALCRCGATRNKPFCDGAHVRIGFKG
jgi:uncharacterized Fe-S cluster protein YjdI